MPQDVIFYASKEVSDESILSHTVNLVNVIGYQEKHSENLILWVDCAVRPRASLAIGKCARVNAWLNEREYVTPEDVQAVVLDMFSHRIRSSYEANAEGVSRRIIVDELFKQVAVA